MLDNRLPPFDLLKGQKAPCADLGAILTASRAPTDTMQKLRLKAESHLAECFGVSYTCPAATIQSLEDAVEEMWLEGWVPEEADINLFVTDFGLVMTEAIQREYGGADVFRSVTDLSHFSLWWRDSQVEAFPFHKAYKRLSEEAGESLTGFFSGLEEYVNPHT